MGSCDLLYFDVGGTCADVELRAAPRSDADRPEVRENLALRVFRHRCLSHRSPSQGLPARGAACPRCPQLSALDSCSEKVLDSFEVRSSVRGRWVVETPSVGI